GDRKPPWHARSVGQFEDGKLYRRVHRDINQEFRNNAVLKMFEHGVAKTVANDMWRRTARRPRRRGPKLAGVLVADIKSFAGGVLDRIVCPRGETKFVGIFEPGVSAAALSNDGAKGRIRDDIGPWRWSCLSGTKSNDVLVTVGGEAAQSIVKNRFAHWRVTRNIRDRVGGPRG